MNIVRIQSKQFIFSIQSNTTRHKVLQINFGKDGSMYVSFPYFDHTNGIVSIGTLSDLSSGIPISLETMGKVTTNKVKFSHHASGDVQFSQTGKVKTLIKKKSVPLRDYQGHIFTFYAQGLNHFFAAPNVSQKAPSIRRAELSFRFAEKIPNAIKIVARWYELNRFIKGLISSSYGPIVTIEQPDGKQASMFLICPPTNFQFNDHVLGLACEEIPLLTDEEETTMLFIGGFISPPRDISHKKQTFLCASYPVLDFENLKGRIGSIDLLS